MKTRFPRISAFLLVIAMTALSLYAQLEIYPFPTSDPDIVSEQYSVRVRQLHPDGNHGPWQDVVVLNVKTREDFTHPIVGEQCSACNVLGDRVTSFAPFGFEGPVEVEVTKNYGTLASRAELTPKSYNLNPHFFDGRMVRFAMKEWGYVSVNFVSDDNLDPDGKGGNHIKYGLMIFADRLESESGYDIPSPGDPGVVVWDNQTDLEVLRDAEILYFPPGDHKMKEHKDNEAEFLEDEQAFRDSPLYHGQLRLKKAQKIYLAGGAYVRGCFNSEGIDNVWLYGRGVVSGRDHLFHEILVPKIVDGEWIRETATKEAFLDFIGTDGLRLEGITIIEPFHHTCPSGKDGLIRNIKILGFNYNNDGVRPGDNTLIDGIFIKTMDDYDYARNTQDFRNSVIWPMFNGSVGMISWSALGGRGWNFHDNAVINAETRNSYSNNDGIVGSQADFGIRTYDTELKDIYIDHPVSNLVDALIKDEGNSANTDTYLSDFRFINIKADYPFAITNGTPQKNRLLGCERNGVIAWVEDFTFTNLVVDGRLVTWENYKECFDLDLTGVNGQNSDPSKYARNITFNSEGEIHHIQVTASGEGEFVPKGNGGIIDCPDGTDQSVSFIPADGYRISKVVIDGAEVPREQVHFFKHVTEDHTVEVTFEPGEDYFDFSPGSFLYYREPENPAGTTNGAEYLLYRGTWDDIPDFSLFFSSDTGVVDSIHANIEETGLDFAAIYMGYVEVPDTSEYLFSVRADDGCRFYIGSNPVVALAGQNTMDTLATSDTIRLYAGKHTFRLEYFQSTGDYGLELYWESTELDREQVPAAAFSHIPLPRVTLQLPKAIDLNLSVISDNALELSWTDTIDNETGFIVERAAEGEEVFSNIDTVQADSTHFLDSGLDPFTLYHYRIKTLFYDRVSGPGDTVIGRTDPVTMPELPDPWASMRFGGSLVSLASSAEYRNDTFIIDAGDGDFWTGYDRGHFIYQPAGGDLEIKALLAGYTHAQSFSMAGVMMRETLDPGSRYAAMFMMSVPGPIVRERMVTDGDVNQKPYDKTGETAPYWIRLKRIGDSFTGSISPDGMNWKTIRTVTVPMADSIYVGMAATTHTAESTGLYTFTGVEILHPATGTGNIPVPVLRVFPNPVKDRLWVESTPGHGRLFLYNTLGEKVLETRVEDQVTELNLETLGSGLYLVVLDTGKEILTGKVLK